MFHNSDGYGQSLAQKMLKTPNMLLVLMSPLCVILWAASGERAVIKGNLTLRSQKTCEGNGGWDLKQDEEYQPVVTCRRGECVVGPRFLNRVQTRSNELNINPVKFGDEGWYIYSCSNVDGIWSVYVNLDPHRSTASIATGSNLTIDLCSLDQVKLSFTQRGSSAPETLFIIDNGQAFGSPKALGGITVSVQNDTAVASNLVQDGVFTVIDSKTDKILCEVTYTVSESVNNGNILKVPSDYSWVTYLSVALNVAFVLFIFNMHRKWLWSKMKRCQKRSEVSREAQEEHMTKETLLTVISSNTDENVPEIV
ncbi:hypothetical protein ACEWY4_026324 [Coilia grayii]|uniref:Uncharacterized protein n=1 Tax=Coilia grayii TaxID=363190 RepID=A0ABD1IVH8_9TELE